jgi:branched-subunit amino acid ABC-type transport system permease component
MPRPIARAVTVEAVRLAALHSGTGRDIRASTVRPEEASGISGSHRGNVSGHRRLLGALIGAGAGIAVGFAVGSRCGAGAPHEECVGYGRLTAAVLGGLGSLVGSAIAAATAP